MKRIVILKTCSVPGMPAFKQGAEVTIADSLAQILIDRKLAKENRGSSRKQVKDAKPARQRVDVDIKRKIIK